MATSTEVIEQPAAKQDAQDEVSKAKTRQAATRVYWIDWARTLAIYLVALYHCMQCLDWIYLWGELAGPVVRGYKCLSLQFGIPLFFFISGRARALSRPTGIWKTITSRTLRLLVPCVVGYVCLVIPFWAFVWMRELPGAPDNFVSWLIWYLHPEHFIFNIGWLWFLPVLFIIDVLEAPIVLYAEWRKPIYIFISAAFLGAVAATFYFFCEFSLLASFAAILGPLAGLAIASVVRFPEPGDRTWRPEQWLAVQALTFSQMLGNVLMVCNFRYDDLKPEASTMPALVLFFSFYLHGYLDQRWEHDPTSVSIDNLPTDVYANASEDFLRRFCLSRDKLAKLLPADSVLRWAKVQQLPQMFLSIVFISLGTPTCEWESEIFPLYSASYKSQPFYAAVHVLGTWSWIGIFEGWLKRYTNSEMHPWMYKHAISSSLVVYLFHYCFIQTFAYWVFRDGGMVGGLWGLFVPIMVYLIAVGGSLLIYALLIRIPRVGMLFGVS
mmetsp:Transcript_73094/g.174174  ORF Transcript_73094/g.174174 Transcript_73094/m.174174 type:complete len:495 (-) Transcript_73094:184-1668(-)